MAQRAGRITCPRCGANNFDTVTACWKCGAPVGAAAAAAPTPQQAPMQMPQQAPTPYQQDRMAPPYPQERAPAPMAYAAPVVSGDSGVARRAALLLGLTIPFIGLPVGWIFMMIEDRNKQAVGRWCAMWSVIGLVIHLFLTYLLVQQSVPLLLRILTPVMEGAARRNASGGDGSLGP
jgi:hypothetical protein